MFSKVFLVIFLGLALLSSVARGYPDPSARDQSPASCSVSPADTSKNNDSNHNPSTSGSKDDGKSNNNGTNDDDPQTSLTLDPRVIAKGFEQNGQENQTEPGQVASLTSKNNYINFCVNQVITNGKQVANGSCNPTPMGSIPSTEHMPSAKFQHPKNFGAVKANTNFTIKLKLNNIQAGQFTNAQTNYYAAPQQLNEKGEIKGHTHCVIEKIHSFTTTTVTDPRNFTFFKGVDAAQNEDGVVTVNVTNGVPEGIYRLASITTAANHQVVNVAVAQHGSIDDMIYFSATKDGRARASSLAGSDDKNKSGQDGDKSKSADPPSCTVDKATTPSVNN